MTTDHGGFWAAHAIERIDRLPSESIADVDRKRLARRLVGFVEIDDASFPCPGVWRDKAGSITLRWECPYGAARVLEILVTHPHAFQASLWKPGKPSAVVVVQGDYVDWIRRITEEFWGVPLGASLETIMELSEVAR